MSWDLFIQESRFSEGFLLKQNYDQKMSVTKLETLHSKSFTANKLYLDPRQDPSGVCVD